MSASLVSAPWRSKEVTTGRWPLAQAASSGVAPVSSLPLILAPQTKKNSIMAGTGGRPDPHAARKAVLPVASVAFTVVGPNAISSPRTRRNMPLKYAAWSRGMDEAMATASS